MEYTHVKHGRSWRTQRDGTLRKKEGSRLQLAGGVLLTTKVRLDPNMPLKGWGPVHCVTRRVHWRMTDHGFAVNFLSGMPVQLQQMPNANLDKLHRAPSPVLLAPFRPTAQGRDFPCLASSQDTSSSVPEPPTALQPSESESACNPTTTIAKPQTRRRDTISAPLSTTTRPHDHREPSLHALSPSRHGSPSVPPARSRSRRRP